MKKWKLGALIVALSFLLAACGPSKEAQPIISEGDKALEKQEYKKAIEKYAQAYNMDAHGDILAKLTGARQQLLDSLQITLGQQKSDAFYAEALVTLKEMEPFSDLMEEGEKDLYEEDKKTIKNLAKEQELLDNYILWSKPYVLELTSISNDWFTISRTIELGGSTKAQAAADLGKLIIRNQKILGDIDTKTMNVHPSLNETHIILYDIVLNNNQAFTGALSALNQKRPTSEIIEAGQKATDSRKDIANFTNKIRNYAEEKSLRDTFQEIIYEQADTEGTAETKEDGK